MKYTVKLALYIVWEATIEVEADSETDVFDVILNDDDTLKEDIKPGWRLNSQDLEVVDIESPDGKRSIVVVQ